MTEINSVLPHSNMRLKINLSAIVQNWKVLSDISGNAGAVVKANAYGLGAPQIATALYDAGCRDFFVTNWQEADQLKNIIPMSCISVLNGIDEQNLSYALSHKFKPVLNTLQQIILWRDNGGGICDLMLDSGINRLGLTDKQCDSALFDRLDIDIAMSHLASADEDISYNDIQRHNFDKMRGTVKCDRYSLANSAGIMLGRDYHYDISRPGVSLYGGIIREEHREIIKPVVSLEVQVLQTNIIAKDSPIGYNGTYICPEEMPVATASLGYADGYLRNFSNKGLASHDDAILPIIGRISMDLITIDIRESPSLCEGDWLEIDCNLELASQISKLSQYELLTGLGQRFDYIYI